MPRRDPQCDACAPGQYTSTQCTATADIKCFDCPKGTYSQDGYTCYQVRSISFVRGIVLLHCT